MELDTLAAQQRTWAEQPVETRGDSPLRGVRLTGADVFWLATLALASPEGAAAALAAAETQLRPRDMMERLVLDMSALQLEEANLSWAHLETLYVNTL